MDLAAARALVQRYVDRSNTRRITSWDAWVQPELVIFDEVTGEKPYGWVFYVNSAVYWETRDVLDLLVGSGPLIVRRDTGELHRLGSAYTLEQYEAGEIAHNTLVQLEDDASE